jgi:hypothetical protein
MWGKKEHMMAGMDHMMSKEDMMMAAMKMDEKN